MFQISSYTQKKRKRSRDSKKLIESSDVKEKAKALVANRLTKTGADKRGSNNNNKRRNRRLNSKRHTGRLNRKRQPRSADDKRKFRSIDSCTSPKGSTEGLEKSCGVERELVKLQDIFGLFIHPRVPVNIGRCAGLCRCNSILKSNHYNTNHAIIRNLIEQRRPDIELQRSLCTPHRLAPITISYLDSEGTFIVENVSNAVIKSCRCT